MIQRFKMDKKNKQIIIAIATISSVLFIILVCILFFNTKNKSISSSKNIKNNVPKIQKVSFVGVGDNLIHDSIYNCADRRYGKFGDGEYDFFPLYDNIKDEIKPFDIRYINQESVIAGKKYGISAYPTFNAPFALMPAVVNAGFNLVNMANNHALDKGPNALLDSINLWNRTGVRHLGTYASQKDRDTPLIIEKNGIKIGILSYTYDTNGFLPPKPYMVSYLNKDNVIKDIERIKPKSDFILVLTHWGDENVEELSKQQKYFAQLFNELGVDAVVGAHVHRLQKVQWLTNKNGKKTLIYYGLGNFVHQQLGATPYLEGMAKFDFVKDGDKKYISNAKFTPLVFHIQYDNYGYDGSVYRLDKYPIELAKKHYIIGRNVNGIMANYINTIHRLVPSDMIDMNLKNTGYDNLGSKSNGNSYIRNAAIGAAVGSMYSRNKNVINKPYTKNTSSYNAYKQNINKNAYMQNNTNYKVHRQKPSRNAYTQNNTNYKVHRQKPSRNAYTQNNTNYNAYRQNTSRNAYTQNNTNYKLYRQNSSSKNAYNQKSNNVYRKSTSSYNTYRKNTKNTPVHKQYRNNYGQNNGRYNTNR